MRCFPRQRVVDRLHSVGRALCLIASLSSVATVPAPVQAAVPMRSCAIAGALGVARVVEIDASKGNVYGSITQSPTHDILKPKEVVLTFDDGPYDGLSRRILDTLDQECTKATFFLVGQMAVARPQIVREEIARGHTVGTHTWSHPMPMKSLTVEAQIEEIDKGIAAVSRVAGRGLAPFFRFPGLGDSPETLAHLKARGIATFSVDVVSNDSFIADPHKLAERTLNILAAKGKGILLFHDIKPSTAAALPVILAELKAQGYRVVHLVPKGTGSRIAAVTAAPRQPVMALPNERLPPERLPPERLPWGLAHQGPMPTILPQPSPRQPPTTSAPASRAAAAPAPVTSQPAQPEPLAPSVKPKLPSRDGNREWQDNIFNSIDKS